MSNNLAIVNNVVVDKYYLYVNTIDNTLVIVTKQLQDLFVKTLTNIGNEPKLISSSYIISDLQLKAIEFGIDTILIDNLNFN
jgi:hypothetical protein